MHVSREHFEKLTFDIARAILTELPPDLRAEAETVILDVVSEPTPQQAEKWDRNILGLYEGVPLVERLADSVLLQPDRITLFQQPLQAIARTEVELRHHIRRTLIHELGHFFGFDEDELHERGWG
jgi:predicted Zn-dependent protease with MMP-like domain